MKDFSYLTPRARKIARERHLEHLKKARAAKPPGKRAARKRSRSAAWKLTPHRVAAMRRGHYEHGFSAAELAVKYGVTARHVRDVLIGKRWGAIPLAAWIQKQREEA